MSEQQIRSLVEAHTKGRDLGLIGEPRVNVLELNLILDSKSSAAAATGDQSTVARR